MLAKGSSTMFTVKSYCPEPSSGLCNEGGDNRTETGCILKAESTEVANAQGVGWRESQAAGDPQGCGTMGRVQLPFTEAGKMEKEQSLGRGSSWLSRDWPGTNWVCEACSASERRDLNRQKTILECRGAVAWRSLWDFSVHGWL